MGKTLDKCRPFLYNTILQILLGKEEPEPYAYV